MHFSWLSLRRPRVLVAAALTSCLLVPTAAGPATAAAGPAHTLAAARKAAVTPLKAWREHSLTTKAPQNWYRLAVTRSTYLSITVGEQTANGVLALFDEDGTRMASSDRGAKRPEEIARGLAPGEYFVRVSRHGKGTARYTLGLRSVTYDGTLRVLSAKVNTFGGVSGELVNTSSTWQAVQSLDVDYSTSAGRRKFRRLDDSVHDPYFVAPGARVPYWTDGSDLSAAQVKKAKATTLTVTVNGYAVATPTLTPRVSATLVRTRPNPEDADRLEFTVDVRNTSGRALSACVVARRTDARGVLVDVQTVEWVKVKSGARRRVVGSVSNWPRKGTYSVSAQACDVIA